MEFSEAIKKIRKASFLSQEDFARELGVSFSTVNRWETGKTLPTYKTMKWIDEFCNRHNISKDECIASWKENR